jgi:hypothetical protein
MATPFKKGRRWPGKANNSDACGTGPRATPLLHPAIFAREKKKGKGRRIVARRFARPFWEIQFLCDWRADIGPAMPPRERLDFTLVPPNSTESLTDQTHGPPLFLNELDVVWNVCRNPLQQIFQRQRAVARMAAPSREIVRFQRPQNAGHLLAG